MEQRPPEAPRTPIDLIVVHNRILGLRGSISILVCILQFLYLSVVSIKIFTVWGVNVRGP